MGNYAIFFVLAGALSVSLVLYSTRASTRGADTALAQHTFKSVVAREAAQTGLNMTVRKMVADTSRWTVNPALYEFVDQPYKNATFTTDVQANYLPGPSADLCTMDTVDVISIGVPIADTTEARNHQIEATYVRTCRTTAGSSSALGLATASEKLFTVNGKTSIHSADASQNSNIHSNNSLYVNGEPNVEGYGTYVDPSNNKCDTCAGFLPNDDWNGASPNVFQSDSIQIPEFNPLDYLAGATHVHNGNYEVNGNTTIDFTNYQGYTTYGTVDNPFVWYIRGDLLINSDTFTSLGYVKIIVEGYVSINGNANMISSSDPSAPPPPTSTYYAPNEDAMREWIATYHTEGTSMGLYVAGTKDDKPDEYGLLFNGDNVFTGAVFANGRAHVNGNATVIGTMVTKGEMLYNGENVLWYVGGNGATDIFGGEEYDYPDGVRLLSYAEW